jgi:hypothetical protein
VWCSAKVRQTLLVVGGQGLAGHKSIGYILAVSAGPRSMVRRGDSRRGVSDMECGLFSVGLPGWAFRHEVVPVLPPRQNVGQRGPSPVAVGAGTLLGGGHD